MSAKDNSSSIKWKYHVNSIPAAFNYHTKKVFEEYFFSWTIEDLFYILMNEQPSYSMKTPQFPADDDKTYKWIVEFLPLGTNEYKNEAFINISIASTPKIAAKTTCEVIFRDADGCKLIVEPLIGYFTATKAQQKLSLMVNRNSLFRKLSLENGHHDVLVIEVKIICAVDDSKEFLETTEWNYQGLPQKSDANLIEDFSQLLTDQQSCDVMVKANGYTAFHAHQAVLIARSPVLAAMLKSDTKEKAEKLIQITDLEQKIVEKLLHYFYTNDIEFTGVNEAMLVLSAADKYDVKNLKTVCEDYLIFKLNTINALKILNAADLHNASVLKAKAIEFICQTPNHFRDPKKYDAANIRSCKLLVDILTAMANIAAKKK